MKFEAKSISDGCLCFCFRSYRWIFYGIRIIPIIYKKGNLMLSHSAGMHNTDKSIAGICPNKFERAKGSKRFHFASLHYIFSAYLPTHIKFLTEFHRIFFGTTCISFP